MRLVKRKGMITIQPKMEVRQWTGQLYFLGGKWSTEAKQWYFESRDEGKRFLAWATTHEQRYGS